MDSRYPITSQGLERIKGELQQLTNKERPTVVKAIAEARAHGDLSENAEYHAAKERQGFIEGRITELQNRIANSVVVEPNGDTDRIAFGVTFVIEDVDSEQQFTYHLVGPYESNADIGHISLTSPIGQALLGKTEGDEVKVKTPGGIKEFEIIKVNNVT